MSEAHKTFISYKYSEARRLRDRIIDALGEDARYYRGETADSPDMTDLRTETIKENLKDMMHGTSVTILIISPHMTESKWIDWELEYCLKRIERHDRCSHTNGIVGVVMADAFGSYDWLIKESYDYHGRPAVFYDDAKLYPIVWKNRYNSNPPIRHCEKCNIYDSMKGSYITIVKDIDFLANPKRYIDNAYDKSENDGAGYKLVRQR